MIHIANAPVSIGAFELAGSAPAPDPDLVLDAMRQLVRLDERWVPAKRGTAIYVRQTMVGTEGFMVVRPARTEPRTVLLLAPLANFSVVTLPTGGGVKPPPCAGG